jgi:hypothetical protein
MTKQQGIRAAVIGAAGAIIAAIVGGVFGVYKPSPDPAVTIVNGVVMRADSISENRFALRGVEVSFADEKRGTVNAKTDNSGRFSFKSVKTGVPLSLNFAKKCYQDDNDVIGVVPDLPYTRYLWPKNPKDSRCKDPEITYLSLALEFGTTFQVNNKGIAPCKKGPTCDPEKKWKATDASGVLRAPDGSTFKGGTAECVAGPCPFSEIIQNDAAKGGLAIGVTVRSWSDVVTYRLSSQLRFSDELPGGPFRAQINERSFDFAINAAHAKFLTIDAKTADGQEFHLPVGDLLGSDLSLPIGDCQVSRKAKVAYHCTLGPDYTFSQQLKEPPKAAQRDERSQQAFLIKAVTPVYPQIAKSARIQGIVKFSANIGFDGKVESLILIDPTGPGSDSRMLLVTAAQDAIKQWIYEPFTKNGQPVPVVTTIAVSFTINY